MKKGGMVAALLLVAACAEEPVQMTGLEVGASLSAQEEKRWAVVFNQPSGLPRNVERIVADAGGTIAARLEEIGGISATSRDPDFAAKIARDPQVSAVSEDIVVQLIPEGTSIEPALVNFRENEGGGPTEPAGPDPQPGTDNLYNQQWDKMRMNASLTGSYAVQRGRRDVVVGILDTGVEILPLPHPDIAPNLDIARSRSFVNVSNPDGDPNPARWDDRNGHGSWCASAVGAPINTIGISGVAPNITLVALKVLGDNGSGSYVGVAQAIVYAGVNKFDVISMSLGGFLSHSGNQALITLVQRAINFARSNGVTPLAALGNNNFNLSDGDFVRDVIFVPAELPGVIGVSATSYSNTKAFYSNYGVGKTDVSAPGGSSTTFDPIPAPYIGFGRVLGAYATEAIGRVAPVLRGEQCETGPGGPCFYYAWIRGTSMATPNAAGVAALIISQYGDFTPDNSRKAHMSPQAVEAILQKTANNQACVDNVGPVFEAFGLVAECQGQAGGYTSFFGKGIVDALKAVTEGHGSGM